MASSRWLKRGLVMLASLSVVFHVLNVVGYGTTVKYQVEQGDCYEAAQTLYEHQMINTLTLLFCSGSVLAMYFLERKRK
jgi:hypothetical protein